ncbi:uncharacterized protein FMAN_00450 [Fusarium mangiferae]|uniref:Uncharacterized protein n=1 Tax=Fusarium mangiferae TaxID=192010 RepID=A0A1L7U7P7_FUSMA|nr:uncharacterized protein FMAN_00450 [Fusarium mangiferae]CVL03136.1 uncharacterized protein FMAN_00450 [Fusarium mangiferae]
MYHIPYELRRGWDSTCAASGTICRNPAVRIQVNGRMYPSIYCEFHACWQIQNGRACLEQKLPRASVCARHIHCQAIDNGTRCTLDVKQGDMLAYRYCPQLHLCEYQDCQNLRSRQDDQYLPLCDDHRCQYDSCRNPRDGGAGVFCRSHTCNEPYCGAFAPGTDPNDPQRFCERHRQCLRPHCPRLCHTRENGHPTPFCGAHYCEAHDCDDGRERGAFCQAHTCVEPGCVRGRQTPGEYCREHTCRTWNCRMRKIGREFCPQHECAYDGCDAEVEEGRFCGRHYSRHIGARYGGRRYPAPGMRYPIYDDGMDPYDMCPGIHDRRGCGRRPEHDSPFCQHHVCHVPNCPAPRTRSSQFCVDHECPIEGCPRPRNTRPRGIRDGDSRFCDEHTCSHPGCPMHADEGSDRCMLHGHGMPMYRNRNRNRMPDGDGARMGRIPRGFRNRNYDDEDEDDDGLPFRQRQFGWAQPRSNQFAAWGRAV